MKLRINVNKLTKALNDTVQYAEGFVDGIKIDQIVFNRMLGNATADALGRYIDSQARMNPEALHHVYEWNQAGSMNARLFSFEVITGPKTFSILSSFTKSNSIEDGSSEPFYDKAEIMESGIGVTITPKNSDVLVFEDNDETIFSKEPIFVNDPGGPYVAGSFEKTFRDFFNGYYQGAFLGSSGILQSLRIAPEFNKYYGPNASRSQGIASGRRYISKDRKVDFE